MSRKRRIARAIVIPVCVIAGFAGLTLGERWAEAQRTAAVMADIRFELENVAATGQGESGPSDESLEVARMSGPVPANAQPFAADHIQGTAGDLLHDGAGQAKFAEPMAWLARALAPLMDLRRGINRMCPSPGEAAGQDTCAPDRLPALSAALIRDSAASLHGLFTRVDLVDAAGRLAWLARSTGASWLGAGSILPGHGTLLETLARGRDDLNRLLDLARPAIEARIENAVRGSIGWALDAMRERLLAARATRNAAGAPVSAAWFTPAAQLVQFYTATRRDLTATIDGSFAAGELRSLANLGLTGTLVAGTLSVMTWLILSTFWRAPVPIETTVRARIPQGNERAPSERGLSRDIATLGEARAASLARAGRPMAGGVESRRPFRAQASGTPQRRLAAVRNMPSNHLASRDDLDTALWALARAFIDGVAAIETTRRATKEAVEASRKVGPGLDS